MLTYYGVLLRTTANNNTAYAVRMRGNSNGD